MEPYRFLFRFAHVCVLYEVAGGSADGGSKRKFLAVDGIAHFFSPWFPIFRFKTEYSWLRMGFTPAPQYLVAGPPRWREIPRLWGANLSEAHTHLLLNL
jgi:hypothetical protein